MTNQKNLCHVCGADSGCGPCEYCLRRLKTTLDSAPGIYAQLHCALTVPARSMVLTVRRQSKRPSSTAPLRELVLMRAHELSSAVQTWSALAVPQTRSRQPARAGWLLQRACVALTRELPEAAATAKLGGHAAAVLVATARARRVLGNEPVITSLPGCCPACDLRALTYREDEYLVECRYCRGAWPAHLFLLDSRPTV